MLCHFLEGKNYDRGIASFAFDLPIMDDSTSNDEEACNSEDHNEEHGEESQSSIHVHDSYDSHLGSINKTLEMLLG